MWLEAMTFTQGAQNLDPYSFFSLLKFLYFSFLFQIQIYSGRLNTIYSHDFYLHLS